MKAIFLLIPIICKDRKEELPVLRVIPQVTHALRVRGVQCSFNLVDGHPYHSRMKHGDGILIVLLLLST